MCTVVRMDRKGRKRSAGKTEEANGTKQALTDQKKIASFRVRGLCDAPVTAFNEKGDLDTSKVKGHIDHMLEYGVNNAFVNGTNGEGLSMTLEERKQNAEAWLKHGKGKLQAILIHIGHSNVKESQELARHAQEIGADAIACLGPSYFKPRNIGEYVHYMKSVAAAAPELPFYLYDFNEMTGYNFAAVEFFREADGQIPTLRGIKHTTANFVSMHSILAEFGDKYDVLLGSNEMYLQGLAIGVDCTIINSYMGHILSRLRDAYERGDMKAARKEQERALAMSRLRGKYNLGIPDGTKAFYAALGMDMGQPRQPFTPVPADVIANMKKDLKDMGYFDWGVKK